MEHLSENTIKKAALSFFKTYYKFRPRIGKTTSAFDLDTNDGIIVDGSLSFQQEDGTSFLATFETTSLETKDEVIFKIQSKLLLWDSVAISLLMASFVASYGFYYDYFALKQIGWVGSLSLMFGVFGISFFAYQYFFKWLKRYRYIYAVEQFKKYHADEQWIAIADDVFDQPTDRHLKELKDQCVINGFGLVTVDNNLETHILITPSRQEVFGNKRNIMNVSNSNFTIKKSKSASISFWWKSIMSKLTNQGVNSTLSRYQRSYWNQIFLSFISLFIIGVILFKEAKDAEIIYVNEKQYEEELTIIADKTEPEPKDFVVDSAFVETTKNKAEPYILTPKNEEPPEEVFTEKGANFELPSIEILITTLDGEFVAYDCERFFNYTGTKYLISEGEYLSLEKARHTVEQLNQKGMNANIMWTGCFAQEKSAYIVFLDLLFDKQDEANLISKSLQRKFKFKKGELQISPITLQKP